jgi:hypothetical protein
MFKKAKFNYNIYNNSNYNKATYTGISKILYTINHKLLDFNINKKFNEHIIEIGGGAEPHIKYMDTKNIKTYTIVDDKFFKKKSEKLNKKYKNITIRFINYKNIKLHKPLLKYTRMISSHSFEHFLFFENDFINLLKFMAKKSCISVALPCDPGLLWRFLQYFSYLKQKNIYKWSDLSEKDLDDSRDHVTPVQNIFKVLKYYFPNLKKILFPFLIPIIEINIFLIIQIKLSDFKKVN